MLNYWNYTDRVTQLEDGTYCWRCEVDDSVTGFAYKLTLGVCGGICAVFIVMGLLMDPWVLKITLLSCLGVMGVAVGVVLLFKKLGGWSEYYWMNDEYIKIGTGKSTRIMEYDKVQRVVLTGKKISLEKKIGKGLVFIPEEDYEFVKNYILQRVQGKAEILREGPWEES